MADQKLFTASRSRKLPRTHKRCPRCKVLKSLTEFAKRKSGGNTPQSYCRDCSCTAVVAWARKNRELHNANVQKWRKENSDRVKETRRALRAHDPERHRDYCRRYRAQNRGTLLIRIRDRYWRNREKSLAESREWRLKNPARNAYKAAEYEARKRRAKPPWADDEKIFAVYQRCAEMNRESPRKYHVDHVIPLSSPVICGLHVHTNLQILSARENQSKSNRFLEDALNVACEPTTRERTTNDCRN